MSTTKRSSEKRGSGSAKRQTVSAVLIILNVLVLLTFLYVLTNNRTTGKAIAQSPLLCAEQNGYSCAISLHCPGTTLQATDTPQCCSMPCSQRPLYHRDFNYDGQVDRQDFLILVKNMHVTKEDASYKSEYDIIEDGVVDVHDLAAWGQAV